MTTKNPWNLTPTEVSVMRQVALGLSMREIGEASGRSERTIEAHTLNCREKMLGKNTTACAVLFDRWERSCDPVRLDLAAAPLLLQNGDAALDLAGRRDLALRWSPTAGWSVWNVSGVMAYQVRTPALYPLPGVLARVAVPPEFLQAVLP